MVEALTEPYNERQTRQYLSDFYERYLAFTPDKYFIRMDEIRTFFSSSGTGNEEYVKFSLTENCLQTLVESGVYPVEMQETYIECQTEKEKLDLMKECYTGGCSFRIDFSEKKKLSQNLIIVLAPKSQTESYKLFTHFHEGHIDGVRAVEFYAGQYTKAANLLPYERFKIYLNGTVTSPVYEYMNSLCPQTTGLLPPFCRREEIDGRLTAGEYMDLQIPDFYDCMVLEMSGFICGIRFPEVDDRQFIPMTQLREKYLPAKKDKDNMDNRQEFIDDCFRYVSERLTRFI